MRKLRALWMRFLGVFGSKRIGDDIDAELEEHIAADTESGVCRGLTSEEARRRGAFVGGLDCDSHSGTLRDEDGSNDFAAPRVGSLAGEG